jgi:outer membrane protein
MITTRLLLLSLIFLLPLTANAEDAPPVTTLLGAGLWSRPAYDGAESNQTTLIPTVRYYGQPWFARTTFGMLEGGARATLLSGFTIGAQIAYEGGRESSESTFLSSHNIETLNPSASIGIHAELEKNIGPMPVIALLRYRQDVDSNRGAQTDLRLIAGIYGGMQLNVGVFVQSTWADANAAQYYYGLTAQQAASTGLSTYSAQGGQLFNAAGLLWSYEVNKEWQLLGSLESRQLKGDALYSPLNQTTTSGYASLSLAYQF